MDDNTVGALIYLGVAIVVSIISATIMRVKQENWEKFDIGDAFLGMILGVVWPLTIVACVVYLASGFLYNKFSKYREDN
jgi:chromate transport protein ChrA